MNEEKKWGRRCGSCLGGSRVRVGGLLRSALCGGGPRLSRARRAVRDVLWRQLLGAGSGRALSVWGWVGGRGECGRRCAARCGRRVWCALSGKCSLSEGWVLLGVLRLVLGGVSGALVVWTRACRACRRFLSRSAGRAAVVNGRGTAAWVGAAVASP